MAPLPPLTRAIIVLLTIFSILNAIVRYRSWSDRTDAWSGRKYHVAYLTIIPGVSIVYPWVFLTATFVEQNVFGLFITGATLFYGGRYLERAWSSREYTKFMLLAALVPNATAFLAYLSLYAVTGNPFLTCVLILPNVLLSVSDPY